MPRSSRWPPTSSATGSRRTSARAAWRMPSSACSGSRTGSGTGPAPRRWRSGCGGGSTRRSSSVPSRRPRSACSDWRPSAPPRTSWGRARNSTGSVRSSIALPRTAARCRPSLPSAWSRCRSGSRIGRATRRRAARTASAWPTSTAWPTTRLPRSSSCAVRFARRSRPSRACPRTSAPWSSGASTQWSVPGACDASRWWRRSWPSWPRARSSRRWPCRPTCAARKWSRLPRSCARTSRPAACRRPTACWPRRTFARRSPPTSA